MIFLKLRCKLRATFSGFDVYDVYSSVNVTSSHVIRFPSENALQEDGPWLCDRLM